MKFEIYGWFCFHLILLFCLVNGINIGVVTMQKDEEDILPYWIEYHSKLFGVNNVLVLDAESEVSTRRILKLWSAKGVKVLFNQTPLSEKNALVISALHLHLSHVDIAVLLDVDEFLVAYQRPSERSQSDTDSLKYSLQNTNLNSSLPKNRTDSLYYEIRKSYPVVCKEKIIKELKSFAESENNCLVLQQSYQSINVHPNETVQNVQYFTRSVLPFLQGTKVVKSTHFKLLNLQRELLPSDNCVTSFDSLGILHYHARNANATIQRTIQALIGQGYLPPFANMDNVHKLKAKINGLHKTLRSDNQQLKDMKKYLDKGVSAFLHPASHKLFFVGSPSKLIKSLEA
jgi:hypothetical protein